MSAGRRGPQHDPQGDRRDGPPAVLRPMLAWLFPGRLGEEVLVALAEEHRKRRQSRGAALAWLWYAGHILLPSSWALAIKIRTSGRGRPDDVFRAPSRVPRLAISWLDVKLGLRMLVKQPGLTLVAVFALAVGIPVGLAPSHAARAFETPPPYAEPHELQVVNNLDLETSRRGSPSLYDFVQWREQLTTFEALGATTRGASYNVLSENGRAAPVQGAEVTASTFDIVRVPPLLGRTLVSGDEVIGAPDVVVVSYDLWQSRLEGDPEVVGRAIRIGGVLREVVGVMPESFLFPAQDHLWLPLRGSALTDDHERGMPLTVFGRLSDGVSWQEAQAEITAVGGRMAAEFPESHARLRHEVVPLTLGVFGFGRDGMTEQITFYVFQLLCLLVLVVACANVAMLVFMRTVTRSGELAVRTALGASRPRIVSQLFTEALVFAVLAAGVGLLLVDQVVLPRLAQYGPFLPYWIDFGVNRWTVVWALSLAVLSAGLVSVVPTLKATGRAVQRNIQRASAGRSGIRFGGISSALIVADVALAVATVGVGVGLSDALTASTGGMDVPVGQFLAAELRIPDLDTRAGQESVFTRGESVARLGATQQALVQRLKAEPGIRGVAVASVLPGMDYQSYRVELDGTASSDAVAGPWVLQARVDPDFFDAFNHPILSGRGFTSTDLDQSGSAVIVNTFFVDRVMEGRNPVGRRLRIRRSPGQEPSPWYDIVGVVGPLGMDVFDSGTPGMYHPLSPGEAHPVRLAIHVGDDPEAFTPRLRVLAGEVDPAATISNASALDEVLSLNAALMGWMKTGGGILLGILITLSASGIYALMSFTVTERTREIGIRTALGAQWGSVVFTIARRALVQLGAGILFGMPIVAGLLYALKGVGRIPTQSPIVLTLLVGACVMVLVGAIACTAPTLRALRIMPTEALREGG